MPPCDCSRGRTSHGCHALSTLNKSKVFCRSISLSLDFRMFCSFVFVSVIWLLLITEPLMVAGRLGCVQLRFKLDLTYRDVHPTGENCERSCLRIFQELRKSNRRVVPFLDVCQSASGFIAKLNECSILPRLDPSDLDHSCSVIRDRGNQAEYRKKRPFACTSKSFSPAIKPRSGELVGNGQRKKENPSQTLICHFEISLVVYKVEQLIEVKPDYRHTIMFEMCDLWKISVRVSNVLSTGSLSQFLRKRTIQENPYQKACWNPDGLARVEVMDWKHVYIYTTVSSAMTGTYHDILRSDSRPTSNGKLDGSVRANGHRLLDLFPGGFSGALEAQADRPVSNRYSSSQEVTLNLLDTFGQLGQSSTCKLDETSSTVSRMAIDAIQLQEMSQVAVRSDDCSSLPRLQNVNPPATRTDDDEVSKGLFPYYPMI